MRLSPGNGISSQAKTDVGITQFQSLRHVYGKLSRAWIRNKEVTPASILSYFHEPNLKSTDLIMYALVQLQPNKRIRYTLGNFGSDILAAVFARGLSQFAAYRELQARRFRLALVQPDATALQLRQSLVSLSRL